MIRPALAALVSLALACMAVQVTAKDAAGASLPTCTDSWASPVSGAWDDGSDWTNGVPGPNAIACVTVAGTYTVTLPDGDFFTPGPVIVGDGTGAGQETLALPGCPPTGSSGPSRIFDTSQLDTVPGGTLDLQAGSGCPGSNSIAYGGIVVAGSATLSLGGTLVVEAKPTAAPEFIATDAPLANAGTITVDSALSLAPVSSQTVSLDNTGVINGAGTLLLPQTGATVTNEGSVQATTWFNGNPLGSSPGSTFANNAGGDLNTQMAMFSGDTFIQGGGTSSGGAVSLLDGSSLDIAGSGSGYYAPGSGTVDMAGDLHPGQTLALYSVPCAPPAVVDAAGSFTNGGTIRMVDTSDTENCPAGSPPQPGAAALDLPAGDTLTNTGSIVDVIVRTPTIIPGAQTIQGAIDNLGTIELDQAAPLAVGPGPIDNSGTISLDGLLTLSGDYAQEPGGATAIAVGSQLGKGSLQASGTVTLAGTLALDGDGVTPASGSYASLLSGGSVTGTFAAATGTDAGNGLIYHLGYTPSAVTVTVGPPIAQSISFTAPATGAVGTSATLTADGGGSGNPVTFSVDPSSGSGVCAVSGDTVSYAAAGSCVIDANQAGNADYAPAPQVTQAITVDQAPAFVIDSPPLTAVAGQAYDYTFQASGIPAPAYALAAGAPSWLSVNPGTGEVTGIPPSGTTAFSYAVTAADAAGTATAGPFTVNVSAPSVKADVAVSLSCPAVMSAGGIGTCSVTVANNGPATAAKVIAGVLLPARLTQTGCSPACARHANVYTWTLGALASGARQTFSITMQASASGKALLLAVAGSASPDPDPLNNFSLQLITIKR